MSNWTQKLEVGDKVILRGRTLSQSLVTSVERLTKTQIILKHTSTKYNRNNGDEVGGNSWSSYSIQEYDVGLSNKITYDRELIKLRKILRDHIWGKETKEDLEKILYILDINY